MGYLYVFQTAIDISIKNTFNTYTLKEKCGFHHHPTPLFFFFFLQPSNNLLPAIVISSHLEEKIINASFEELKGRDTLFVGEWLRQKGPEKLYEIFES